ncbi:hypothetical protein [uncultured Sphingomonas sp.]|uniref:hypothetical protein n=1 Tax=uncultured Sphingomonas sp. TaxID=158754 RepID=UPI0035CC4770
MSRQHATPLLLGPGGAVPLSPLPLGSGPDQISEAELQQLLHEHPQCLPIAEIDPLFAGPVPMCMELSTNAGPIDNLLITPTGLPVLVECKLWRNPQQRREVVGQILDYAKELARWSASDLQREVARRMPGDGNPILRLLRAAGHEIDEIAFNDALTHNLRRGRFLLLIVGDGIREGVEAIAEYLQVHAGLHFSLGLIELPVFVGDDGRRLIVPRVLARTELITRTVVTVPEGQAVQDDDIIAEQAQEDEDPLSRINFWTEFVRGLHLDDPEQPPPRAGRQGYLNVMLPVPSGNAWLTVYRTEARWEVGVYLSYTRDTIGARVVGNVVEDWPAIAGELGGTVSLHVDKMGRRLIQDSFVSGSWRLPAEKERALAWLRTRTNEFVNVLRPRIKAALADHNGAA